MSWFNKRLREWKEEEEKKRWNSSHDYLSFDGQLYNYAHAGTGDLDLSKTAQDLVNAADVLLKKGSDFANQYHTRYAGSNTTYRSDSEAWRSNVSRQKSEYDTELAEYMETLSKYKKYYSSSFLKKITDELDKISKMYSDAYTDADNDYKYWSQWETEDDYNTSVWENDFYTKVKDGKYDEAEKALLAEQEKLTASAPSMDMKSRIERLQKLSEYGGYLEQEQQNKAYQEAESAKKAEYEAYDVDAGQAEIDRLKGFANRANEIKKQLNEVERQIALRKQKGLSYSALQGQANDLNYQLFLLSQEYSGQGANSAPDLLRDTGADKNSFINDSQAILSSHTGGAGPNVQNSIIDFDALLREKQENHNTAVREQSKLLMRSQALKDPEFESYADTGAGFGKSYKKNLGDGQIANNLEEFFLSFTKSTEPNNKIAFLRNHPNEIADNDDLVHIAAKYMSDEEFSIYNYYFAKDQNDGTNLSEEYLTSIADRLNMQKALDIYEQFEDKPTFVKQLYSIPVGLDQFISGIDGIFADEYTPTSATQYAGSLVREDLADEGFFRWYNFKTGEWEDKFFGNSSAQMLYDIGSTTSNMLPSILTSVAVGMVSRTAGAAMGATLLGASAGGNAKVEMLNMGYSKDQANAYGLLVGASEAGLSYIMSGIPGLRGADGVASGLATKIFSKVDNTLAKVAIALGGVIDEGIEEGLQTVLESWFKEIATGVDFDDPTSDEILYSSLLGMLSAAGMNAPGVAINAGVNTYNTVQGGKNYVNKYGTAGVDALVSKGLTMSEDTAAYKQASKLKAKLDQDKSAGNYAVGKLLRDVNEEGGTLSNIKFNNVDYDDNATKNKLMRSLHDEMIKKGSVVRVSTEITDEVSKSFPDLHSLKKKDRTPILKQSMIQLKQNLKQYLSGLKEQTYEFDINGRILEARLYNPGIREVLEKVTQEKANMLYSTQDIFNNARYLYSTSDYSGDPNVYRWNYFYTPVQIENGDYIGVRIAVRDVINPNESQIYNWGIKKDTLLDGAGRGTNDRISYDVSSSVSGNSISQDGTNVNSENLATPVGQAKNYARILGMGENGTRGLVAVSESLQSGADLGNAAQAFNAIYNQGRQGKAFAATKNGELLTPEQRRYAYQVGVVDGLLERGKMKEGGSPPLSDVQNSSSLTQRDGTPAGAAAERTNPEFVDEKKVKEAQAKVDAAKRTDGKKKKGAVIYDGDRGKLSDMQKKSLEVLDKISEALGVTFHIYESRMINGKYVYKKPNGKKTSANGWYDSQTGEIWLDINAGNNGEGVVIFTAAHELTHFIKQWSPAKFKIFADFLIEQYQDHNISVDELVQERIDKAKKNGRALTKDQAYEEVIADSCESFLRDSDAVEKIAQLNQKDASLAGKIKQFIGNMLKRIRELMKDTDPQSREGQIVSEMTSAIEQLHKLWTDALIDAGEAYSGSEGRNNVEVPNSEVRYSERDFPIDASIETTVRNAFTKSDSDMHELGNITEGQNSAINRLVNQTNDQSYRGKYTGGKHLFSDNAIKHIIREHGDFLREGLRAQLPMTAMDIARHLSAIKDNKVPSSTKASKTSRGTPSILTSYEVNGYTLYAEEIKKPLGKNLPSDLIGHTMYKAPTLATAAFNATSAQTQPKRQSVVLCSYYTPNGTNLSTGNFVQNSNGQPAHLCYISASGAVKHDSRAGGLIPLSADQSNFTDKSGRVEQGYVRCNKPFYITADNRVFSNSDTNVAEKINELKKQGYDCFIFEKTPGDNYMVAVVNKAQIIKNKPSVVPNSNQGNAASNNGNNSPHSDRDPDAPTNRELLINALETDNMSPSEKGFLTKYKNSLSKIEANEAEISRMKSELKGLQKNGKGKTAKAVSLESKISKLEQQNGVSERLILNLEVTRPIKNLLNREREAAYKKAVAEGREKLAEYKEKVKEREKEIRQGYRDSRAKSIEGRHKTEMRHKIQRVVAELDKLLRHGNKKSNVKIGLQDAVAAALEAFDINAEKVERYNKDMARLDAKIATATDSLEIEALTALREKKQRNSERLADKLQAMKKAYEDIHNGRDGENYPGYYKAEAEVIENRIAEVIEKVGNTPIGEMSLDQLDAVYDMYRMVLTTVQNANKVFRDGKLADLTSDATDMTSELQKIKKLPEERLKAGENIRGFVWNELTPYYAFKRVGSGTLMSYYDELVRGQDVYARDVDEAKQFALDTRKKHGYGKWKLDEVHSFRDKDGRKFDLTLKHMMSIYAYSKREQALDHMEKGGFFFNNKETFRKKAGVLEFIASNESGYKVDASVFAKIKGSLTAEQIAYVDEMQSYLTKMGEKGNEVTRVMWGIDIFKEKVYFPLKSKEDFIYQANTPAETSSLKNDGMTKETKPHASNPIVLEAFDEVWANHVEKMSKYHGFVIPIDNLNKLINYGTWMEGNAQAKERKYKSFADQIDDVSKGIHNPRFDLYVSETPGPLLDLNFSEGPLLMRNSKVKEILDKHPEMSKELLEKIPEAINDPVLILKSKTHPTESVVVITDIMTSKGEMIVPVWINQEGNYIDIDLEESITSTNFVASAYGRNIKSLLEYANKNEGFLYQSPQNKRVSELLARNGLQLSTPLKLSNSTISIPQEKQNVNKKFSTNSEMGSHSISTMLEARFGSGANDYLTTFIKDLNGAKAQSGGFIGGISNLFTKFKKTAVGASLSVVVQQPTAIIRATSEIDAKYFAHLPKVESLNKKWEQIQKYAPIAIIKDIGGFDAGSGCTIAEWINADTRRGVKRALNKIDDVAMYGAALGDRVGWGSIWTAVIREVQAKQGLKYGTEEFWQACGKRFTEVIVKTQVYDSTLSRSGFMRGKDSVMKMATSFMGEPTLSVNMIADSILQAKRGEIKKRQVIRTVAAVYTATVAASIIKSFIYALRDDDEDESFAEKYMQALGGTILNDINPLSMLPVTRDVISILEGWDVGRSDMEIVQDLYNAITALDSEEKTTWRKIEDLAGAMGALAGIPAKNFLRTAREVYNLVNDMFDGIEGGDLGGAFLEGVTGKDKSKSQTLYEALIDGDPERIAVLRKGYDDDKEYYEAVRKALREYDPRIREAACSYIIYDIGRKDELYYKILAEGNFSGEVIDAALESEMDSYYRKCKDVAEAKTDGNYKKYEKLLGELHEQYGGYLRVGKIAEDIEAELASIAEAEEKPKEKFCHNNAYDANLYFGSGNEQTALAILDELMKNKIEYYFELARYEATKKDKDFDEWEAMENAEWDARESLRGSMTDYWKETYQDAYASGNTDEMTRIRNILESSGLYIYKNKNRTVNTVLEEWSEELSEK